MFTAETVTDEQLWQALKDGIIERRDYLHAVKFRNKIVRARCAEILNAHNTKKG